MDPQFPAEARLLKPAPRRFHARRLHVIHPHHTGADGLNHTHGAIDIPRPDSRSQPERSVVGNLERLTLVIEWNHADHRAKDLFPRNPRRVIHVVKDRRLDVITAGQRSRPAAAQRQLGFLLAQLLISRDPVILFLTDSGPILVERSSGGPSLMVRAFSVMASRNF